MKDKIDILDRYFNTFINLTDTYEFFTGLADYLAYIDLVPEIEKVASELPKITTEEHNKIKVFEKEAIDELLIVRDELKSLVSKLDIKKEQQEQIDKHFKDFEWWLEGKMIGSNPLPTSLFSEPRDVISALIGLGYKKETLKYVEYNKKNNPEYVEHY